MPRLSYDTFPNNVHLNIVSKYWMAILKHCSSHSKFLLAMVKYYADLAKGMKALLLLVITYGSRKMYGRVDIASVKKVVLAGG